MYQVIVLVPEEIKQWVNFIYFLVKGDSQQSKQLQISTSMKTNIVGGRVAKSVGESGLDCLGLVSGEVTYWDKWGKKDVCVDIWDDHFEQREQTMVKMRNGKLGAFEAGKAGQCKWRWADGGDTVEGELSRAHGVPGHEGWYRPWSGLGHFLSAMGSHWTVLAEQ